MGSTAAAFTLLHLLMIFISLGYAFPFETNSSSGAAFAPESTQWDDVPRPKMRPIQTRNYQCGANSNFVMLASSEARLVVSHAFDKLIEKGRTRRQYGLTMCALDVCGRPTYNRT
jgi:hypothetical protein